MQEPVEERRESDIRIPEHEDADPEKLKLNHDLRQAVLKLDLEKVEKLLGRYADPDYSGASEAYLFTTDEAGRNWRMHVNGAFSSHLHKLARMHAGSESPEEKKKIKQIARLLVEKGADLDNLNIARNKPEDISWNRDDHEFALFLEKLANRPPTPSDVYIKT